MPIYEYRCPDCGTVFEKVQSFSAPTVHVCEACGFENAERIISMTSFHLKGGGWYKDGYSSSNTGNSSSSPKAAEGSASGSCSGTPASCSAPGCGGD